MIEHDVLRCGGHGDSTGIRYLFDRHKSHDSHRVVTLLRGKAENSTIYPVQPASMVFISRSIQDMHTP